MNLGLFAVYIFGLIISLNASPMMTNLMPCLGSHPSPESILNLQKNIYDHNLSKGLIKKRLVNFVLKKTLPRENASENNELKLDPDYVKEVLRSRDLIQKGKIDDGRIALFKITKARTLDKFDKYTDEPSLCDQVIPIINKIVTQFIKDVQNGK